MQENYLDNFTKIVLLLGAFLLPLSRAANSIFVIYFIIYCIMHLIKNGIDNPIFKENFSKILLIFILYILLSITWSSNIHSGIVASRMYLRLLAIFGIAIFVSKYKHLAHKSITYFLYGMVVSEILSYGLIFGLWTIHGKGANNPSPYMHHIEYSVFLAFTSLILLNRILSKNYTKKEKLLMSLFFTTVTANLFLNVGRTGEVAFIVGAVAIFFLRNNINIRSITMSILFILSIVTIAYNTSNVFRSRADLALNDISKIIYKDKYNTSIGLRIAQYIVGWDSIKKNPILGSGTGSKEMVFKNLFKIHDYGFDEYSVKFLSTSHAHSQYLQILIENGTLGLLLLIILVITIIKTESYDPEIRDIGIIFVIVFFISSLAEPLLLRQFSNTLFIYIMGLYLSSAIQIEREVSR